ncbi:MAG: thioredoxin domain-containing protein [Planctomycetota bacterium]
MNMFAPRISLGAAALLILQNQTVTTNDSRPASTPTRPANHLAREKSPYLLQHVYNPVDWYPWGNEAFEKAKKEDKPIFLSIGYSTCHWCHVMERESFENDKIAEYLKQHFVSIKVDREERPDVDRFYMAYVQAVTGSGGWPMTVFLTPELKPFYGGTYFPPFSKYGRPGFMDLLTGVATAWKDKRATLTESAAKAVESMQAQVKIEKTESIKLDASPLDKGYEWFARSYDEKLGGFGGAPKFPRPSTLLFLLRYHYRNQGNAKSSAGAALEIATNTLRQMARGGMHDQLGGGFHRYSVDARWHVPHFEKMLYDQGQLAVAYAEGYKITKDEYFAETLRGICDYVLRDLTSPQGAFFSAEDADSVAPGSEVSINTGHPETVPISSPPAKREGAFYVFTNKEITTLLGGAAPAFSLRYGVEESGNADDPHGELTGTNVFFLEREIGEVARRLGIPREEAEKNIEFGKKKLLDERNKRPRPHLDDKILASWNGYMISGLAHAAAALHEPKYTKAAERAAAFMEANMYNKKTGELWRRHRDGDTALRGQCDDYANLISGLLDLYQVTFNTHYIEFASTLQRKQDELFYDSSQGAWYSSPAGDASILLRMIEDYDGAEPSPSAVSIRNCLRLAELTGSEEFKNRAETVLNTFAGRMLQIPAAIPQMLASLELYLSPPQHVVLAGDHQQSNLDEMIREFHSRFLPNATLIVLDTEAAQSYFSKTLPFTTNMKTPPGKATAYVCVNRACKLPVTNVADLIKSLDN